MSSRRALLRQLWAMARTRAEAAGLVLQLQRGALTQGLIYGGIAAVAGLSFTTAAIVWIAVAAPPAWRGWALGLLALALAGTAAWAGITARRKIQRDASLVADYARGLKLDLAMISLALKDPNTEDEQKLAERESAKQAVREAAVAKAATPSTAEASDVPAADGVSVETAEAAMRAAEPRPDVAPAGAPAAGPSLAAMDEPRERWRHGSA